jgi:hypothetical protein
MLGATAAPDVEVMGFSAPTLGGEAGFRVAFGSLHAELRGFALGSTVTGPITDTDASDEFEFRNTGFDLRAGIAIGSLMPYLGAGQGHTTSTLTVVSDGAQLDAETDYRYVIGGLTYDWEPLAFTYEQRRTEDYVDHFVLAVSARF